MKGAKKQSLAKKVDEQDKKGDESGTKLFVEFHLSLFHRDAQLNDDHRDFFFGRTVRTSKLPLKRENDGSYSASKKDECIYFHTALNGKVGGSHDSNSIFLVVECLLIAYREINAEGQSNIIEK
jgi:hypothetical protein